MLLFFVIYLTVKRAKEFTEARYTIANNIKVGKLCLMLLA